MKKRFASALAGLVLFAGIGSVDAMTLESRVEEPIGDGKPVVAESGKVRLGLIYDDGVLKMVDQMDGKTVYALQAADGSHASDYAVWSYQVKEPDDALFEVAAVSGAHGQNVGYWLIGRQNGQWRIYVDWDSLAAKGYTKNEWHQIRSDFNLAQRSIRVISSHEYLPSGARFEYEREHTDDFSVEVYWDDVKQDFSLR